MTARNREKARADLMRDTATEPAEGEYWRGYRQGLTARSEHHDALLAAIGDHDQLRDARGRGYRDGRAFTETP